MSYSYEDGPNDLISIRYYQTESGRRPFGKWFDSLDGKVRAAVDSRLTRLRHGHWGDFKYLGCGVYELRFHAGAGHRIDFGREGDVVVVLLYAGEKSGQYADIEKARRYWQDYVRRNGI